MRKYVISYDLHVPGRDYSKLIEAIKSYSNWCHLHESVWLIHTDQTSQQVCSYLMQFIDRNDQLFVAGWTGEASWYGLDAQRENWVKAA
jgi:hypothetical protein